MGADTLQELKLSHLEFENDDSNQNAMNVFELALPDELPQRTNLSHLPKEILKSSSMENLISQNEDLMARLKVALRRLSLLENENQKISEESNKTRIAQSSYSDQILIWKEKDARWKQKVDELDREKSILSEKISAMHAKMQLMNTDLVRHEKYHEKIKNQIKPYIAQLKDYSQSQNLKIKELEDISAHKEGLIRDIRHQLIEVTKNTRTQLEASEKKSQEIVDHYEEQIEKMSAELKTLKTQHEDLEIKALKLNSALERQDALENEVVTLKRSKIDLKERFEEELKKIQERQSELTRQNQKLGVEHADLQIRVIEDQEKIQRLELENRQQLEQLESLRFMWSSKNEETERLKMAAGALERLNIELSQKLNELRR
jgi:chromosome segregation ATPase